MVPYSVVPYGGEINSSLELTKEMKIKYPFLNKDYFLSISRSIEDNQLREVCNAFKNLKFNLVLISNFSKSQYGKSILDEYSGIKNIILIDGLYIKPELDLVRRNCKCYIHTHTTCGTAPSLVEMIICNKPIISFDVPQNRNTLEKSGAYFKSFYDLVRIIKSTNNFSKYLPKKSLMKNYKWPNIIESYENLF